MHLLFESGKEVKVTYYGEDVGIQKLDLLIEGELSLNSKQWKNSIRNIMLRCGRI